MYKVIKGEKLEDSREEEEDDDAEQFSEPRKNENGLKLNGELPEKNGKVPKANEETNGKNL